MFKSVGLEAIGFDLMHTMVSNTGARIVICLTEQQQGILTYGVDIGASSRNDLKTVKSVCQNPCAMECG